MFIYTPPDYDENTGQVYPVLYLLHGGCEDERGWAIQGKTNLILDNLIADQKAPQPMLVAMIDGNMGASGLTGQGLKIFETELMESIIPFVESNFRVQPESKGRALAGL